MLSDCSFTMLLYVSFPDLKKYVANCYGCRGYQNSVPYAWI